VKRIAILLLPALLIAAGCGSTRTRADQDRDGKLIAASLRTATVNGSAFKMDQHLRLTGGGSNAGQYFDIHATVNDGLLREDTARFTYRMDQGTHSQSFQMLVADGRLFVRPRGRSGWKDVPLASASSLFPLLRLDLLRQTVLLAGSVSVGGAAHVDAGFARKFAIRPAVDQAEQVQSMPVQGADEEQFLKTASTEVDAFLVYPGDQLGRLEVHMNGTDPQSQTRQDVNAVLDLRPAHVGTITPPADAQAVSLDQLLT
jgi:hypothetical protein